jgi:hypothetical protein
MVDDGRVARLKRAKQSQAKGIRSRIFVDDRHCCGLLVGDRHDLVLDVKGARHRRGGPDDGGMRSGCRHAIERLSRASAGQERAHLPVMSRGVERCSRMTTEVLTSALLKAVYSASYIYRERGSTGRDGTRSHPACPRLEHLSLDDYSQCRSSLR